MAKSGHPEAIEVAQSLFPLFKKHRCDIFLPDFVFSGTPMKAPGTIVSEETLVSSADLMVVLGGDGTLLKTVRMLKGRNVPVIGIKLGGMGFLTEMTKENMVSVLDQVLRGSYTTEERLKLRAVVKRHMKELTVFDALNDAVIHTSGLARVSNYKLSLNGQFFTYLKADGVLVATPTGSTAYSFAAGGPIVDPQTHLMILTPICPKNLAHRPIVISSESKIEIQLEYKNSDVLLTMDGQESFALNEGDTVEMTQSDQSAFFVRAQGSDHLKTIRNKLFFDYS